MWSKFILEIIFLFFVLIIPPALAVLAIYDLREISNKIKKLKQ